MFNRRIRVLGVAVGLAMVSAVAVPSLVSPALGADAGRIIYSGADGPTQLDMSGSGVQAPFSVPPVPSSSGSMMSPDGSKVAYALYSYSDDGTPIESDRLFVMNSDGTGLIEIPVGIGVVAPDLAAVHLGSWAPDSSAFAYTEATLQPQGAGVSTVLSEDVFRVDANGANRENLTATGSAYTGMWSPDGTKIAFISDSLSANPKVSVMDHDGTDVTPLTDGSIRPIAPLRWFPDGSKIAFAAWTGTDATDIFWIAASGGSVTQVTDGPQERQEIPFRDLDGWTPNGGASTISPDGSHLIYRSSDTNDFTTGRAFVVAIDGSDDAELQPGAGGFILSSTIVYSPDGLRIAYMRLPTDLSVTTPTIYVANADGSNPIPVADGFLVDWIQGSVPVGISVVGLVDPGQGLWHLYDDSGVQTTQFFFGNPGDFPIVGDWDCDGVETPGMYRQSDGYVYLRNSNTQGAADVRFFFGDPGDVPIAGDFNNDGCDTVSIYRPSSQTFYIINELGANDGGLGAADFSYVFGDPGDKPFVGDFDGDGTETVGLHRESTGLVYFRNSHTQGNADAQFIFGDPGDRLIAGDWNNNGAYSPALYRPGNTTFYFRYTNTQGNADNQFIPVPNGADWLPVAGTFE